MNSYLKFLSRNKLYTAIESVGLAVSLDFVILNNQALQRHKKSIRQDNTSVGSGLPFSVHIIVVNP